MSVRVYDKDSCLMAIDGGCIFRCNWSSVSEYSTAFTESCASDRARPLKLLPVTKSD